jgi:hypothetical protein
VSDPRTTMPRRPTGSNADEWHLFLCGFLDNRATSPSGLTFIAVQIAEAIDAAARSELTAENTRLSRGFMRRIRGENKCDAPCRDTAKCGCWQEVQAWCEL